MAKFELTPSQAAIGKRLASVLAIGAGITYSALTIDALAHQDPMHPGFASLCDNANHEALPVGNTSHPGLIPKSLIRQLFASDNRSWSEDAATFSKDRGYYISADRLEAVNANMVSLSRTGAVSDTINASGAICFNLPGPIVWGQIEQTTSATEQQIADSNAISLNKLWSLNSGLPHLATYIAPKGSILEVGTQQLNNKGFYSQPTDTTLVYDRLNGPDINTVYHNNQKLRDQVIMANAAAEGNGKALTEGSLGYFTFNQTPYDKKHHLSTAKILKAYANYYQQLANGEQGNATNPNSPRPYNLNEHQQRLINGLKISESDRKFIANMTDAVMSRVNQGDLINPEAVIAQAILESGFGQSQLSRYNNVFGIKAGTGWKGRTVVMPTQEQSNEGQYYTIYDTFRVYDSLGQAVEDYDMVIGNGLNHGLTQATALACRRNPSKYLDALQYEVNNKCQITGPAQPDTTKASYSTDHNYVSSVLNIIKDYKLTAIIHAGLRSQPKIS